LYLAVALDLVSRQVVGWGTRPTQHTDLVLQALLAAVSRHKHVHGAEAWPAAARKAAAAGADRRAAGDPVGIHTWSADFIAYVLWSGRCFPRRPGIDFGQVSLQGSDRSPEDLEEWSSCNHQGQCLGTLWWVGDPIQNFRSCEAADCWASGVVAHRQH